ncbi:hypothetical protein [Allokutzneria oryzae]|uniref:HAF repeat-containing protein n=1 Tax=Allokutzneria oryzae TaxID=1378989 RepID=A0ABV5ZY27_9PSEU
MRSVRLALPAVVAVVAAVVVGPGTAVAAACTWKSAALPLPDGITQGRATASDNEGGYAGVAMGMPERVVLWKPGKIVDYGRVPFAPYLVTVADVNRSGTIVGHAMRDVYSAGAFRSVGTRIEALPVPAAAHASRAVAVNDRGDIVGQYVPKLGELSRAVMWPADRPGQMVELTGLPASESLVVSGIDEDGTVLVEATGNGVSTSYRWRDGVAMKLVPPVPAQSVFANGISAGRVVGTLVPQGQPNELRAVQWDASGNASLLPEGRAANSVNRDGLVVGDGQSFQIGALVWRGGKVEAKLPSSPQLFVGSIGDDGGIPAYTRLNSKDTPVVYSCS